MDNHYGGDETWNWKREKNMVLKKKNGTQAVKIKHTLRQT